MTAPSAQLQLSHYSRLEFRCDLRMMTALLENLDRGVRSGAVETTREDRDALDACFWKLRGLRDAA